LAFSAKARGLAFEHVLLGVVFVRDVALGFEAEPRIVVIVIARRVAKPFDRSSEPTQ